MVETENKNDSSLKAILTKKPYSYFIIILAIIFFLIVGIFSFKYLNGGIFTSFQVSGANFDLGIKKIPYNVKSIDITFNEDIDPNSINNELLKITPSISGIVKLKNSNTISYELSDKLQIGNEYSIVLSKNLKSKNGKKLDNDLLYILKATSAASVLKVLPEESLENLSSNISVFFSIPMVNLSSLDLKNELPCPIEISPSIFGKCKWTTSSVLEFVPDSNFNGSTKYNIKVVNKNGLNYQLEKEYETSFTTPKLSLNIPTNKFLPKDNLVVSFNFPVALSELENNLSIEGFSGVLIEKNKNSDLAFTIKPSLGEFKYDTYYKLLVKKPIKPLYGNISFDSTGEYSISSSSLVSSINNYQNVFSSTGLLIDTKEIYFGSENDGYKFLPNKDIFLKINFNEEVPLEKNLFLFQDNAGNKIDFDIKYGKTEDENKKVIDDKTTIDLTLKGKLSNDNNYKLIISKTANKNLINDLVYEYKTSKKLEIVREKTLDYSKTCIYTNNKLPCEWGECDALISNNISLSNSGVLKSISEGEYNNLPWEDQSKLNSLTFQEQNKFLEEKGYCGNAGSGEYLYVLNTRLRPNSTYNLEIKNLNDIYSNILGKSFSKEIKTGNLRDSDKYVYSSFPTFRNVFPKNVPTILDFQTINTDNIYVNVCELGENEYIDYLANIYSNSNYKPKCLSNFSTTLKTKNNYWNLTNNKFDLYKDILGKNNSQDYLLVTASQKKDSLLNSSENIIVKTNLNLFLEKASNKSLLFATDIGKKSTISDLKLEFFDLSGKKVEVKYSFNKDKKVYEIDSDLSSINYIKAQNKDLSGIVTSDDYFPNYDFKYISGMDSSIKNYLYVYTDRPIYRPGDEVFIKGILREFNFDGFKKSKITKGTLKIQGEDYSLYRDIEVTLDKNSNFTGSFIIPKDSTLGAFNFQFEPEIDNSESSDYYDDSNYVYTNSFFYIEEYKKPTFKVDLTTDKEDFSLGQKTKITVNPKYYFGGKMVNTDGSYSILSQNYFFDAKEFSDYQFGESSGYYDCLYWGYCEYSDNLEDGQDFKISPNGDYNFEYEFPKTSSGEKLYTFSFDVTDPDTQKTVSNSITKVLHSTDSYVGLKASYYNTKKSGVPLDLIFLDYNAKPIPYKTAKVDVIKRDWKEVKTLGVDGVFYSDYSLEEKNEKSFTLIGDKDGKVAYNLKTASSGEYEIKVTYTGADNNSYVSSNIIYVDDNEYMNWRNSNNTVTDLEALKTTYKLGETASFILKSPVNNGKALVLVEKDDGIIDYFVHDIKSYSDKIDLKITDKHYPNVYVKAFLIGNQEGNPLPVYKRALSVVKVLTDYKNLNISIKTDKENYNPGDKVVFDIEVLDKEGKPVKNANGTLSVVDESLLALKGNPKKNPYSFFYEMKRYLGVVSYSSLKYLVDKLEVKDTSSGEKGGSGEGVKGGESKKSRGNFKDTAFWVGDFTTDNSGKSTITLDALPDNLTTWVIEALVNTSEDSKIGVSYDTIMTSKELMIEDNLPRFISGGDFITLSPVIYNRTGKDDNFKVSISSSLGTLENLTKNVFVKAGESSKVNFNLNMVESNLLKGNDISKITIFANSSNKLKTDSITKYIRVLPLNTKEQVSTIGKTTDVSYDEKISLGNIIKNDSVLKINYAGTLFTYLLDSIDYNNNFPYGCSEQKTSALMPNIYVKKLYDAAGVPFDLKKKMITKYIDSENGYKEISLDDVIKDYLIEIKKFQNVDGGFSYWYDGNFTLSDTNLTTYILSSLSEIKSLGYTVDKDMLEKGSKYLKKEFYDKKVCDENNYINCLPFYTKVKILNSLISIDSNDYEIYKMYKLLDFSKYENSIEEAGILSNLVNVKDLTSKEKEDSLNKAKKIINKILSNNLVFNPRGAFVMGFGNNVTETANLLSIISNLGLSNFKDTEYITDNMIRFIISSKENSSFGSTFDNSFVIKSLSNYLGNSKELLNPNYFARLKLNGQEIDTKKINKDNIFENFSKEIPLKSIKNENTFNVTKEGSGTLYYDLNLSYYVSSKDAKSVDEGFYVETKYYDYNEYKKIYTLKDEEYKKYLNGEIKYEDLVYKKDVVEYLKPILYGNIGDLVMVYNKVITNEDRNQVAIESYIPSGSEIVNTNLSTETKQVSNIGSNIILDREEMRDDRYFGWLESLNTGIYNVSYTIRLTHSGKFSISPTKVSDFYNPEVFGRSKGIDFIIK